MEFLKIENLCKVYGKGENQVTALDHVSLTIEKGEFTAIIGSSGSGKSTLLHIIGGVDVPTSGKVYLDGQDVYAQSNEKLAIFRRRQVGLIYQFHNLIPTLNVVENITLPILMDKRKVNEERLNDLLEHAWAKRPQNAFTQSAFGRSATACFHRTRFDECPGSHACRRTHGQFGQPKWT